MYEYDEDVLEYFLQHQQQLFPENVAATPEEAEEFLSDCMAVVLENLSEVREYLDESGMDITDMRDSELTEADEVFTLPDGRFLVVEG